MLEETLGEIIHTKTHTISDVIRDHAINQGQKLALIFQEKSISYEQLNSQANKLANALLKTGIASQSRIAYWGKESEKYYELLFACAKAKMILVPINWRLKMQEVSYILEHSQSRILFVDTEFSSMTEGFKNDIKSLETIIFLQEKQNEIEYNQWIAKSEDLDPLIPIDREETLALMYTSGTTGLPKGVELAHRSFFQIRKSLLDNELDWIDWRSDDKSLIGIPGFHIGGLWWSLQGFCAGITNVSMPYFLPGDTIDVMQKHNVTIACVVPAMIAMILKENENYHYDFSFLRKIVYGGSPIAESILSQAIKELDCEFAQIYGLTETGNTAVCLPPQSHILGSKYMLAAGKPYPCVKLKITDKNGMVLKPNEVGEVYIHTPAAMKSYWNLPEETKNTLIDGWIRTGDAGYLDEEGYLFICDRIKDTIIVAGEKIYPAEVENAINKHPLVLDCAVVGIPDEKWGEAIQAFIALKQGEQLTAREVFLFLKNEIADYKIPTKYEFVEKIPRNASGKILRRELRDSYWVNQPRNV